MISSSSCTLILTVMDGREDKEGTGNSRRNMVEVVVLYLIKTIFRCWKSTGKALSIGVVSLRIVLKLMLLKLDLTKKHHTCDGFHVRVKSIDGFQGEEDDIIILYQRLYPMGMELLDFLLITKEQTLLLRGQV